MMIAGASAGAVFTSARASITAPTASPATMPTPCTIPSAITSARVNRRRGAHQDLSPAILFTLCNVALHSRQGPLHGFVAEPPPSHHIVDLASHRSLTHIDRYAETESLMQPDLRSTTPIVQRADDAPDVEFRPPAPVPHRRPLNVAEFVLTAVRNPLELWGARAYSEPVVRANWLGTPTIIVSDPAAIRYLLVENADNYVMQPLRQRVLRPILRDGLLTAEGALWRRTRRAIAPIFAPRNIAGLAPVMRDTAEHFATALGRAGEVCDLSVEMTRLTYEILQATLFSGDIAGEPAEFAAAVAKLLRTMGHVDPLDILDAPAFLPRTTRALGRRSERYFRALIAATIERRQQALARGGAAPNDLLTL